MDCIRHLRSYYVVKIYIFECSIVVMSFELSIVEYICTLVISVNCILKIPGAYYITMGEGYEKAYNISRVYGFG